MRWLITLYDRAYRSLHGLDTRASEVGSALRIEVRRSHRTFHFNGGTIVHPADCIGVLHLNNERVVALHSAGASPVAVGLQLRRQLLASLHALARLAGPGGRLSHVHAFQVMTIFFHRRLGRFGFEEDSEGLVWPGLVAAYQCALRACLHPTGSIRRRRAADRRAQRLWLTRETLLTLYGDGYGGAAAGSMERSAPG